EPGPVGLPRIARLVEQGVSLLEIELRLSGGRVVPVREQRDVAAVCRLHVVEEDAPGDLLLVDRMDNRAPDQWVRELLAIEVEAERLDDGERRGVDRDARAFEQPRALREGRRGSRVPH